MPEVKFKRVRVVASAILIVTGLYVVCLLGLTLAQRKLIYHPCNTSPSTLQVAAERAGFAAWIDSDGETIGWGRLSRTSSTAPRIILLLHGNAGCGPDWFHYAAGFQAVEPVDFYILEYPGYGGRAGKPSQASILAAADAALKSVPGEGPVFLVGESLGTGVASYLSGAHDAEIGGVFLVAPYDKLTAVAGRHLPFFPVSWMLHDKYPSTVWLQSYHGPLAVLLAGKDTTIPMELGRKLFDAHDGPKKLWIEAQATHEDVHRPTKLIFKEVTQFWNAGRNPR
jgi:fermentation-respiration switch protein FrsA (DUF1100 family)